MTPITTRAPPPEKAPPGKRRHAPAVAVGGKACKALAECVAFFRASRFRDVKPGDCRDEDRCAALTVIKATLRKLRKHSS